MATLYTTAKFQLRTDGTGSTIGSAINLSMDDDAAPAPAEFYTTTDTQLQKVTVRALYFPTAILTTEANQNSARALVLARLDSLLSSLRWRPPIIKELPRGRVIMPKLAQNWGDLQMYQKTSALGPDITTVVLADCTLLEGAVEEDPQVAALVLRLTFGKPVTARVV